MESTLDYLITVHVLMFCPFSRANKNESFHSHLEHLNCKLAILHQLKTSNCPSLQAIRKGVLHYLINDAVGLLDTLEQSNELEKIQLKKYSCDVRLECTTQLHPVRTERELSAKKRLGALEQQASLLGCDYNLSFLHTATSYGPKVAKAQKRKKPHSDYVLLH